MKQVLLFMASTVARTGSTRLGYSSNRPAFAAPKSYDGDIMILFDRTLVVDATDLFDIGVVRWYR